MVGPSYIHENVAEIQTSTQMSPISDSMAARRLLSPSSILPQPSSHCAFIPAKKNSALVTDMPLFDFLIHFSNSNCVTGNCVGRRIPLVSLGCQAQ
jgi:hypothetical protein